MNHNHWSPKVQQALHEYHGAAPLPPSIDNVAQHRPLPRRRHPAAAIAAVVLTMAAIAGLVAIAGRHDGEPTGAGTLEVHHTRYRVSIEGQLECDRPIIDPAQFDAVMIDMWADRVGRQWRHQVTYPDGTTFDVVMRDSVVYPTALFERGTIVTRTIGCVGPGGDQMPLVRIIDPYDSITLAPELAAEDRPFVRLFDQVGQLVDTAASDSRGRTTHLWEQRLTGTAGFGNAANLDVSQRTSWWVDAADGITVTERQFHNTIDTLGTATTTDTLLIDETIDVPTTTFSTSGYRSIPATPRPTPPNSPETTVRGGTPSTGTPSTGTPSTSGAPHECPGVDLDLTKEPSWRQPFNATWYRGECVVRIDVITDRPGLEHCGWASARVIVVGRPIGTPFTSVNDQVQYVRDPSNAFRAGLDSGYEPYATLPPDAVDTGYRTDTEALWVVPGNDRFIYLVLDGRTERWPKGDPPLCD